MRAVFTVVVPLRQQEQEESFPSNTEILKVVRRFGWEPVEIAELSEESEKDKKYKELAAELFKEMPEIAVEEQDDVIFFGYLADDQTKFVITRRVEGLITFRLLHPVLPRLQSSTTKMIRKIMQAKVWDANFSIADQNVVVYERGFDHIILNGRVIPHAFRETISRDRKDTLLLVGPLLLGIPLLIVLANVDLSTHQLIAGTLERTSTAMLTTSVVSALGFFQTYYEIKRHRLIAWSFTSDSRTE